MKRIAVFASGTGSNFRTIVQHIQNGHLRAEPALLVVDNSKAKAADFARAHHIPVSLLPPRDFADENAFGRAVIEALEARQTDFIVLAGYLKKIPDNVIGAYPNRILNIHPALLPAFGGKGMHGRHVHEAVFRSGAQITGVTVHLINNEYDAGPIVLQAAVNVRDCQNPAEIAEKVLKEEHRIFPEAIKLLLENPYRIEGNRVIVERENNDQN